MKKTCISLFILMSISCFADESSSNGPKQVTIEGETYVKSDNSQGRSQNGQSNNCSNVLLNARKEAIAKKTSPTGAAVSELANGTEVRGCRIYEMASIGNGSLVVDSSTSTKSTIDKAVTCVKRGSYTLDYKSCSSTADMYNYIVGLEKLMLASQNSRLQNKQTQISQTAATQTASGDGQNAALAASAADNNYKSSLSMEQAEAYSVAVTAMGAKIATWQSSSASAMVKLCGSQVPDTLIDKSANVQDCKTELPAASKDSAIFANNSAKGQFIMIAAQLAAKAAAAMIAAKKFSNVASAVTAAQQTSDTSASTLAACTTNPTLAECVASTTSITPGQSYTSGDFSMGSGSGNNSFGDSAGTSTDSTGTASTLGNGTVAGVDNPFAGDAKKANDILNPAGAAKVTPQGGAGGGGGGAGGSLGGGGASLGNDLSGATKAAAVADVKSNKAAASYTPGAGGFRGVASTKEENPFASMFDSKSGGGVEEDDSISPATGGEDSGLFQKISKRYSQIQADKRVEAVNLE